MLRRLFSIRNCKWICCQRLEWPYKFWQLIHLICLKSKAKQMSLGSYGNKLRLKSEEIFTWKTFWVASRIVEYSLLWRKCSSRCCFNCGCLRYENTTTVQNTWPRAAKCQVQGIFDLARRDLGTFYAECRQCPHPFKVCQWATFLAKSKHLVYILTLPLWMTNEPPTSINKH